MKLTFHELSFNNFKYSKVVYNLLYLKFEIVYYRTHINVLSKFSILVTFTTQYIANFELD